MLVVTWPASRRCGIPTAGWSITYDKMGRLISADELLAVYDRRYTAYSSANDGLDKKLNGF